MHWGVDSLHPAHLSPGGYPNPPRADVNDSPTLYAYVSRRKGNPPVFWGRYINNYSVQSRVAQHQLLARLRLTDTEVRYIHNQNCKIAILYNGIDPRYDNLSTFSAGRIKASDAIGVAQRLNIPHHVRIFADLEGFQVSADWILGWCNAFYSSQYADCVGIYGRVDMAEAAWVSQHSPNRRYWSQSIIEAVEQSSPQQASQRNSQPGSRPPLQHRQNTSASRSGSTSCQGAGPICRPIFIWCNQPQQRCDSSAPADFRPNRLPIHRNLRTVLWQYAMDCWQITRQNGSTIGLIDMDLSIDENPQWMW